MKILSVSESTIGGEQIATQHILRALRKQGHQVQTVVLAALQKTSSLAYAQWLVRSIVTTLSFAWRYRNYPILYTSTFTALVAGALMRPLTQQTLYFHYHGNRIPPLSDGNAPFLQRLTQLWKHWVTRILHQLGWSSTAVVFVPSSFILQRLFKQFPQLGKKQVVVPNGVNAHFFHPVSVLQKKFLRQKYKIPSSAFVCAVVGRLEKSKHTLESLAVVHAVHTVSKQEVFLVIVTPLEETDTAYALQVRQKLTRLGIPFEWITLRDLDANKTTQIAALYQLSDCVISHSAQEVFPLVLLEAAACEVPYFASKNGVTEQYLQHVDRCLILPSSHLRAAQHMVCCAKRTELRRKLRQFSVQYSWEKSAQTIAQSFSTS